MKDVTHPPDHSSRGNMTRKTEPDLGTARNERRKDEIRHSRLAPLNLLASCSLSGLGDMERGSVEGWGLRRLRVWESWEEDREGSAGVGQGRLGGRSPLS